MRFRPDQIDSIKEELSKLGIKFDCALCNGSMEIVDELYRVPQFEEVGKIIKLPKLPVCILRCTNCGNMLFFNAGWLKSVL